MKIPTALFVLY